MPVPATTGELKSSILDMSMGDYIEVTYVVNPNNTRTWSIGRQGKPELPVSGIDAYVANYFWYMVKVDKGLLITDRVIWHTTSWINQNNLGHIEGVSIVLGGVNGVIRSLTGGVAYADINGNKSLTDQGFGGWPTNNEWDKYITNFPEELIQEGKVLDDVFHISRPVYPYTWTQNTPVNGLIHFNNPNTGDAGRRILRAISDSNDLLVHFEPSSLSVSYVGFRPVFEYKELS